MTFNSFVFIWIFLPTVLMGVYLTHKRGSNLFLLVMSLLFYAWGEPKYIVLLLLSITINYCAGRIIESTDDKNRKKILTGLTIAVNLAVLGYFKYFNFFAENINQLFLTDIIPPRKIALPIGISFYTFQSISYIADLYHGTIEAQRSWVDLALYISLFPQLVAGPIVKYKNIDKYLHNRTINICDITHGLKRFCFGLGKKVILANTLGVTVDSILSKPIGEISWVLCWSAAAFYMMQIYFDFSGYSDMAIGLAETLGFRFPENFDLPYISTSVREFWRRWHISLSTWFRDYLYIPLGGNRKGKIRTVINLAVVFLATGLWHGAQWNFILWGAYHGFFLITERSLPSDDQCKRWKKYLKHAYTLLVVCIGWVLFRADNMNTAFSQIRQMFVFQGKGNWSFSEIVDPVTIIVFCISVLLSLGAEKAVKKYFARSSRTAAAVLSDIMAVLCLFISIVRLANAAHDPFIYFRF